GRRRAPSQLHGGQRRRLGCWKQRLRLSTLWCPYSGAILDLDGTRVASGPKTITTVNSRIDQAFRESRPPRDKALTTCRSRVPRRNRLQPRRERNWAEEGPEPNP